MALTKAHNRMIAGSLANIVDFGAVEGSSGSAATNTAAIQAAIDSGKGIYIPYGDWYFDNQITNPDVMPFICDGQLIYTGDFSSHAIVFGADDGAAHQQLGTYYNSVNLKADTASTYDAGHQAGVACINCFQIQLAVGVEGFKTGLLLNGADNGMAYSKFTLQRFTDCETSIKFHATGTDGYVNQNTFIGGRISVRSSATTPNEWYGVAFDTDNKVINNNIFYNPSFEMAGAAGQICVCFYGLTADCASWNSVYGGRMEMGGAASDAYFIGGTGIENCHFEITYSDFQAANPNDIIYPATANDLPGLMLNTFIGNFGSELFVGRQRQLAYLNRSNMVGYYTGSVHQIQAPARGVWLVAGSSPSFATRRTASLQNKNFVISVLTSALGYVFDLRKAEKDFSRRIDVKAQLEANGGRLVVQLWDSSYNLLAPTTGTGFVVNKYTNIPYRISSTYEWYQQSGDRTVDTSEEPITFGEDVAYAFIGISGGTDPANVRELDFFTYGEADISIISNEYELGQMLNGIAMMDTPEPVTYGTDDPESTIEAGNSYSEGLFARRLNYATDANGRIVIGHIYDGAAWQPVYASAATWV